MKIAYLLLVHNNMNHYQRLIKALVSKANPGAHHVFVHVDKKSKVDGFQVSDNEYVHLVENRHSVYWGDYTMVAATMALLREAYRHAEKFDRFVLMSGADFPLHAPEGITKFFEQNRDTQFINMTEMPNNAAGKPIRRLIYNQIHRDQSKLHRLVKKLATRLCIRPKYRDYKPVLKAMTPYGGCQWWAFNREAAGYVVNFFKTRKDIVQYYRNTVIPDESLFQLIIGNSEFGKNVERSLTFTDWSGGGSHPAILTHKHLDKFESTVINEPGDFYGSGVMLFARKFPDDSADLVERLYSQFEMRKGYWDQFSDFKISA